MGTPHFCEPCFYSCGEPVFLYFVVQASRLPKHTNLQTVRATQFGNRPKPDLLVVRVEILKSRGCLGQLLNQGESSGERRHKPYS